MSNSTNDMSEKLVRYLDGELQGSEKAELEKQLVNDKTLGEQLEELRLAKEAIRQYGLKQDVAGIHRGMMQEFQSPTREIGAARRIIRYTMSVAAGLLIIFLGFMTYNYFSLSPGRLFRENYRSYELTTVRGGSGEEISPVEKAYREKKYTDVVAVTVDRPFTIKEDFLRAMSYAEIPDNAKAIDSYKQVIVKNDAAGTNSFRDEVEYYLALAYIRDKNYNEALVLLEKIQDNPAHLYHDKITGKLIRKVKRLR